jgi:hypothetical protein
MPLFMAYCPDYPTIVPQSDSNEAIKEDDTYAKRLSVRQEHWARAQVDRQAGRLCMSSYSQQGLLASVEKHNPPVQSAQCV